MSVEDSGPGVPPELREMIFERFRQGDSGPTRRHGGTGLGLSIASEFVALHCGSIEVTGGAEGGARFIVRVPLKAPEGSEVKTTAAAVEDEASFVQLAELLSPQPAPGEEEEGVPADAPLVLVVEDNPEMNSFITEVMRRGHRVVSAFDGAEGVEKALRLRPDLIISDVMMPRMTGVEMIREIREHRELDDVPILLLTAKADEELRVRLLSSGAQDSLPKPFLADELLARAAGLVARKRKAEESLRQSEELFRKTFENAAVGMAHVGLDGRWLRINERLAAFLGYSREELSSMTFQEITHPEDLENDLREYEQLKRHEIESYSMEKRYLHRDGRVIWGRLTVSLLRSPDGAPLHAISIIEDITDRKSAEEALQRTVEELQKARDYLEVRVKERTAELTRALEDLRVETGQRILAMEELRRNEQMLIEQSRMVAMGEMLRNISHQWRQPLNVLAANVQMLGVTYQYGQFTEELLKEAISNVMAVIKKLSQTLDDLQEYLAPAKETSLFPVDEIIRKTIAMIGESYQNQGISIIVESSDGGEVYGDSSQYGQVLMNLLSNARDALLQRRESERRITINSRKEKERSVVTVTDNAGGVDEAISEKIFEPYFTTKELGKGTGVGLFLSKMIIEKNMNGRLTFRNVNGGAEFEIRI